MSNVEFSLDLVSSRAQSHLLHHNCFAPTIFVVGDIDYEILAADLSSLNKIEETVNACRALAMQVGAKRIYLACLCNTSFDDDASFVETLLIYEWSKEHNDDFCLFRVERRQSDSIFGFQDIKNCANCDELVPSNFVDMFGQYSCVHGLEDMLERVPASQIRVQTRKIH